MSSGDEYVSDKPMKTMLRNGERFSIYTASTPEAARSALKGLHAEHEDITAQLESAISSHEQILRQLGRLDLARARLGSLAVNARSISHGMLSGAASTAGRISEAVERLDLEQARVNATLEVVEQVAELKACVLGVVGSMGAPQDWETAAEYISRTSRIPREVIDSGFAEQVVPTAEVPDAPRHTLDSAAQSLCQLFLREFERAVEQGDGARVTRFFKMFPLIGRSKEGLDAYGRYVCSGVALRARASLQTSAASRRDGFFYVNALTKLFEHIAQVVDGHSTLVERHYGAPTMVKVMERLHAEADVQGGIILDTWSEERSVERKLTDVKSYAFSFLVQSFLPQQRSGFNTPRTQSPALGKSANIPQRQTEDSIEMKEVDQLLNEIVSMLSHWSLYLRFVSSRVAESESRDEEPTDSQLTTPSFLATSNLPKKISKILIDPFSSFATYFLRRSVEKAFQMDESPAGLSLYSSNFSGNPPYITSAVDDVMYIVDQVLHRILATSQVTIVVSMISTIARVLGSDFIGMVQRKMRDESYPKAAIQGAQPPEDKIISFLVLMNNLDVASIYINRIVRSFSEDQSGQRADWEQDKGKPLEVLFPMHQDAVSVRKALEGLENTFVNKAGDLIQDGMSVAFLHVIKPRIRPTVTEAFREMDYSFSDENGPIRNKVDDYDNESEGSEENTVKARIQSGWDGLMKPIKKILSERNYNRLIASTASNLADQLEKRIWSYQGRASELGAVKLERDVHDVANVVIRGESFRLRELFHRCIQIVTIMNMEDEEWEDIKDSQDEENDSSWTLTVGEQQRARSIVKGREMS